MKSATQVRCDDYSTTGNNVRVTSRKDFVISTDLKISRNFNGRILRFPILDSNFDEHRPKPTDMEYAHIDTDISVDIDDLLINKSISKMDFYPMSCQNRFQVSAKERALLLPYICDKRAYENKCFRVSPSVSVNWVREDDTQVDDEKFENKHDYYYHPTITGKMLLRTERSSTHYAPDSFTLSSFFPLNLMTNVAGQMLQTCYNLSIKTGGTHY